MNIGLLLYTVVTVGIPISVYVLIRYHASKFIGTTRSKRFKRFSLSSFLVAIGTLLLFSLLALVEVYSEYVPFVSAGDMDALSGYSGFMLLLGVSAGILFAESGDNLILKVVNVVQKPLRIVLLILIIISLFLSLLLNISVLNETIHLFTVLIDISLVIFFLSYLYGYASYWFLYRPSTP